MCRISIDGMEGAFLNDGKVIQFDHMNTHCLAGKLVSQILSRALSALGNCRPG